MTNMQTHIMFTKNTCKQKDISSEGGSPSIGAFGLHTKRNALFSKVPPSLGDFGAHGHVHVPTFGSILHASGPKLSF